MEEKKFKILDEDGKLNKKELFSQLMKTRSGSVGREAYLREVLEGKCPREKIEQAVRESPTAAGISTELLKMLADENKNAALAALKEKPDIKGKLEAVAQSEHKLKETAEALDSIRENKNLRELFHIAQQDLYLFGFPEVEFDENGVVQGERSRLCMSLALAVMMDVENAADALKAMGGILPEFYGAEVDFQKLESEILSEVISGFRKKVMGAKTVTAAANSNPVLGKAVSVVAAKTSLEKYCDRLRDVLSDTGLTNPEHRPSLSEQEYAKKYSDILK